MPKKYREVWDSMGPSREAAILHTVRLQCTRTHLCLLVYFVQLAPHYKNSL